MSINTDAAPALAITSPGNAIGQYLSWGRAENGSRKVPKRITTRLVIIKNLGRPSAASRPPLKKMGQEIRPRGRLGNRGRVLACECVCVRLLTI